MQRRSSVLALVAVLLLTGCTGSAPGAAATSVPGSATESSTGSPAPAGPWTYAASTRVTAPADLAPEPLAACARTALPAGWTTRENARPGTSDWKPANLRTKPQLTRRVPLYPDRTTTTCGSPVRVHLGSTSSAVVTVRAYRVGWYHGAGGRLVWSSPPVHVPATRSSGRSGDAMSSPGYATTVTLPVDRSWVPGQYLVETWLHGGIAGVTGLEVRDDTTANPFVVVHSVLTWTAYSQFDNASLYKGEDGRSDSRALQVDIARPLIGAGLVRLLVEDVPVTQFLERRGFGADHIDDIALDAWPSMVTRHAALVLPGHSEYWTRRMYDGALAARNAGVNLLDLGANEVYWHTRLTRDSTGRATSMFVARTLRQDPVAATDPSAATVEWHKAPLNRDPTALLGQRYSAVRANGSEQVRSLPAWLSRGTRLKAGDVLVGLAANETDGVRADNPRNPPDVTTLIAGVLVQHGAPDQIASATYYSDTSGAAVFVAGTTYWACDLTHACPDQVAPAATESAVRSLTANLLAVFARPRAGATHPSVRAVPASTAQLKAQLPASCIGRYGAPVNVPS